MNIRCEFRRQRLAAVCRTSQQEDRLGTGKVSAWEIWDLGFRSEGHADGKQDGVGLRREAVLSRDARILFPFLHEPEIFQAREEVEALATASVM
jgi:hypothetical protein